jgi:putative nucleotidyltransferase with HDIG domain
MGTISPASLRQYLPYVFIVTVVITLTPAVLVWALASEGLVDGFVPLVLIGLTASIMLGYVGRTAWQRRPESKDFIFADLLLWGWIRRYRIERRLGSATALLGISSREARKDLHPSKQIEVLKDLATALESRDPYTHGHSRRVARYSAMIAEKLGLSDAEVSKVRTAAAVHDVGKLELPLEVLNKPGKLTDDEFAMIKSHAPLGAEMVKQLGDRELTEMVAHHHERLDGTGYPSRLSGNQIPLGARIIAVADTFDALTSTRAYRGAKRHKEALAILHAEAGTQLDPLAVQAFDRCYAGSLGGLTVWALLAALPHRLWAPLESQINVAQAASGTIATKAITVAAATAATGTIALSPLADPRDTSTDDARATLAANSSLAGGGPAITRVADESDASSGPAFTGKRDLGDLDGDEAREAREARELKSLRIASAGAASAPAAWPCSSLIRLKWSRSPIRTPSG